MAIRPPVPNRGDFLCHCREQALLNALERERSRWWAYRLVFEGLAFGIVFRKPHLRGISIAKTLR